MKRKRMNAHKTWLVALLAFTAQLGSAQQAAFDGLEVDYSIVSVGVANGSLRTVSMDSARRISWAQYALWSNNNRDLYFKDGEIFYGPIHANTAMYFSGNPEFFGRVSSAASTYGGSIDEVIFHNNFRMNVPAESIASVNFSNLVGQASMTLSGPTTILLSGTNMIVTNTRKSWNKTKMPVPTDGLVYIAKATSGSSAEADLSISGILKGRVTFVTERDINITSNIVYSSNPKTNSASTDSLGLISNRDVVVTPSAPKDLSIFAHILATGNLTSSTTDGSFGVQDYDKGSPRGVLSIHGGIAQDYRGAVGTFNTGTGKMTTGYEKNYTYDTRFTKNPPPHYPPLDNRLLPGVWRDR